MNTFVVALKDGPTLEVENVDDIVYDDDKIMLIASNGPTKLMVNPTEYIYIGLKKESE
ncbi:hypothetical protein KO561_12825 [Radiobacillus kanasensis]|uniref:hypothetical protein n=1 Tax=Radiobacillus kanasensis TaxID=2844358 RepID=UPI001E4F22C6|nr:hypothetical protein [Radiobacillus kanasensis]UFT98086.1 hypothetical protein KO561_12825 [Radiobacillus kanasensis]